MDSSETLDWLKHVNRSLAVDFFGMLLKKSCNSDLGDVQLDLEWMRLVSEIYVNLVNQDAHGIEKLEAFLASVANPKPFLDLAQEADSDYRLLPERPNSEQYCQPVERFQIVDFKIPFALPGLTDKLDRNSYNGITDERFEKLSQEFDSLVGDRHKKQLLSFGMARSYANMELPKVYEVAFDFKNPELFYPCKSIVKYAYNFRTHFHTDLWHGFHSHVLIEFIGEIPKIFDTLPVWKAEGIEEHPGIGLCTKYDWQFIQPHLQRSRHEKG